MPYNPNRLFKHRMHIKLALTGVAWTLHTASLHLMHTMLASLLHSLQVTILSSPFSC